MNVQTFNYKLVPGILTYTDKETPEFRSPEAILAALEEFPGIPVAKVTNFDGYPTCNPKGLGETIGRVVEVEWQQEVGVLEIRAELFSPISFEGEVRVSWECKIRQQKGQWEGQKYEEIQTDLKPKFVMVL